MAEVMSRKRICTLERVRASKSCKKSGARNRAPRLRLPRLIGDDKALSASSRTSCCSTSSSRPSSSWPSAFTTFHAVRDLPVAPTWQKTPDCSGKLANWVGGGFDGGTIVMSINRECLHRPVSGNHHYCCPKKYE